RAAPCAGDHREDLGATALRRAQEGQQRSMRLVLGPAVKVDAGIDRFGATRKTLLEPPIERLEPGRGSCRRHGGARRRTSMGRRFRLVRRRRPPRIGRGPAAPPPRAPAPGKGPPTARPPPPARRAAPPPPAPP